MRNTMKLRQQQRQITRAELILDDVEVLLKSKVILNEDDLKALKFMIKNLKEELKNEQKI